MPKTIFCCIWLLGFFIAVAPARSAEQGGDCEARIKRLDASQAEGTERLAEKNAAIEACDRRYKRDKTIDRLVRQCAKYEEQPVIKQQFVAECMLAAYSYANALYTLKAEFGK